MMGSKKPQLAPNVKRPKNMPVSPPPPTRRTTMPNKPAIEIVIHREPEEIGDPPKDFITCTPGPEEIHLKITTVVDSVEVHRIASAVSHLMQRRKLFTLTDVESELLAPGTQVGSKSELTLTFKEQML